MDSLYPTVSSTKGDKSGGRKSRKRGDAKGDERDVKGGTETASEPARHSGRLAALGTNTKTRPWTAVPARLTGGDDDPAKQLEAFFVRQGVSIAD